MNIVRNKWLILCLLFLSALTAKLALASNLGSLRFDRVGAEQGFAQQSITAMTQDRLGFMWFGTQAGLVKFDGYRTTVFHSDPHNPNTISDNFVSAFYEHRDGKLWVGSQSGLSLYNSATEQFRNFTRKDSNATPTGNYKVFAILSDGAEGLWLATDYGLVHFDMQTFIFKDFRHEKDKPDSLRDDLISAMVQDQQGNLWIGTPSGLDKFNPKTSSFEHIDIKLAGRPVTAQNIIVALSISSNHLLWVASDAGLTTVTTLTSNQASPIVTAMGDSEGFAVSRIQALFHDQTGKLWIGTVNSGVTRFDPLTQEYTSFRHRPLDTNSLLHNHVSKIFQDRTGVLWVGSKSAGLSRVDLTSGGFDRFVQFQDDASGNSDNRIRSIVPAGENSLWLGTYAGGLLRLNTKTRKVEAWSKQPGKKGALQENQIGSLRAGKNGTLWVGTRSGLSLFDPTKNTFTPFPIGTDPNDNYIERILFDSQDTMWVSSRGGLHFKEAGASAFKTLRHDANDPGSPTNNWGMAFLEDRQKTFWVGTMNGLDRYDKSTRTFTHFLHNDNDPTSISHNRIHYLYEDRKGQLWIGTSGGLNRMDRSADGKVGFQFFATQADGSAESVGGILEDQMGNIWISSTAGISRLDIKTGKFKNYTAKDGMIDGSYLIGAAYHAPDGTMIFGGWTGITSFKPENVHDNTLQPKVVITDFLISNQAINKLLINGKPRLNESIHDATSIELSYLDSIFAIEFAALHYADPMANRYAYKLENFNPNWVEADAKKRFATYTNLDPGDYVFRVKASNKNEVWDEEGLKLAIHIAPPYWKTWWFRVSLALLLGALAYSFFLFRIRLLLRQKMLLERQVKSRTQELESQKSSIEKQKENVEQAHKNISLLSEIGKKITATLDSESIVQLLYEHVNDLMDATVFGVGFYVPEKDSIEFPFVMEAGKRYEHYSRDFRLKNQLPVWCIENQKDILINDLTQEYHHYIADLDLTTSAESLGELADGTAAIAPQSLLYVPILVKNAIRGVVSVHSYKKNAYQRTDLDVLRTLASYVGIALDNADAYDRLKEAQEQLVEREKLAALGSLVAGVAHELNTPLGNSLLIASAIEDNIEVFSEKLHSGPIKRSEFSQFADRCKEACVLLLRNLKTSANLVSSFKQVAVDQASAQRRSFNLEKSTQEIVATMMNQVRQFDHVIEINIPEGIVMNSYPGSYGQVIINLLQNAIVHAFDGRRQGVMRISATTPSSDRVLIRFEDNGAGIPEENITRIFEPFFTTKLGQGGSGLGLNVTYNIVTSILGGQIKVESVVGQGTSFTLNLPLNTVEEILDQS